MNKLSNLALCGLLIALYTEIIDNFIINHRTPLLLFIMVPIYAALFFVAFKLYLKYKPKPLHFSLIMGVIGIVIIENIILKKFVEPWPIQIFMFSYWFSIFSYPLVMLTKSIKIFRIPLSIALVIAVITSPIFKNIFITLPLFIVLFFVSSAVANFIYLRKRDIG